MYFYIDDDDWCYWSPPVRKANGREDKTVQIYFLNYARPSEEISVSFVVFLGNLFFFFWYFLYFFWETSKTIFDKKFLWKDGFCTKLNIFQGLQVTSIHIYYELYFAFRDIVFSNVVSMGIKNLTLTHASQSCLIQHCKHSHWKYKNNIIIKKLGSCANMAISPYSWGSGVAVVAVVVVAWEPMWW